MPKTKPKKSGLALSSDFKKQKTKLGKGKQSASNATDTSFKTRSIALPQQSVTKDKGSAPVTRRNHTLDDLIAQSRHYSALVRKEALQELEELLIDHPRLAKRHAGIIVNTAARLVADDDTAVRKAVRDFLAFALEKIPATSLQPYVGTLLLYTTSAMSHIYPDVRLDAVRVADICRATFGSTVTQGWQRKLQEQAGNARALGQPAEEAHGRGHGERLLDCYLNLLGASLPVPGQNGTRQATASASLTSIDLSPGARLIILRSLTEFMQETTSTSSSSKEPELSCPTWFFEASFDAAVDFRAFQSVFDTTVDEATQDVVSADLDNDNAADFNVLQRSAWTVESSQAAFSSAIAFSTESWAQSSACGHDLNSTSVSARLALFEALEPLLVAAFLDSAPVAFPPGGDLSGFATTSGQLVCVVAQLVLTCWRGARMASPSQTRALSRFLDRLAPYFPFGERQPSSYSFGRASDPQSAALKLNLAYCELVSLWSVVSPLRPRDLRSQLRAVNKYIVEALSPKNGVHSPLREHTLINILPTVWLLLNDEAGDKVAIFSALLAFWDDLPTNDSTKKIATEFIGRLTVLPLYPTYRGGLHVTAIDACRDVAVKWITTGLPRYLWELGTRGPDATALALELLRQIACAKQCEILRKEESNAFQRALATFFQINHPKKGIIDGPYKRMPAHTQRRAEGLIAYLLPLETSLALSAEAVGATPSLVA